MKTITIKSSMFLTGALTLVTGALLAACIQPDSTTTSSPFSQAPSSSSASPVGQTIRPGSSGTLILVNGNNLIVSTGPKQTARATMSDNTSIQRIVEASFSDIAQGQSVDVAGSRDDGGNITASLINIHSAAVNKDINITAGAPGLTTGNGQYSTGTVSSIKPDLLVLSTGQGNINVKLGTGVIVQKMVDAVKDDLKEGQFVRITGSYDKIGILLAETLVIYPEGMGTLYSPQSGSK